MSLNANNSKELQKKQNTITFINATTEMIEELGIEHISIRKIAEKAGFHNSTIYLYFKDLDELLLLASMKFFQEYSHSLSLLSKTATTSSETFIKIWDYFLTTVFKWPNLFFNFFYGKRSDDLTPYMNHYYELYPEERNEYTDDIHNMYYGKNIEERSSNLLKTVLNETDKVTADNMDMVNEIIVSYCKYKLEQKRANMDLDNTKLKNECLHVISYVTGV
ncbi:TetR/AcrR family transcriptional regulator [Dorea sp. OM07-5]|uniref:TetR/AcrR family transcriptional regulator n=1 Tax=Dorea sp. OM07-5 TaxID=2293100 RepID=UPI000E48C80F|nr:TetR/AcrR family transcriptional regulator [Dorea sp. OM07-5]RHU98051.1 TetR/AcrR family transcriptional regulator [Dorea sp. OM07-5]